MQNKMYEQNNYRDRERQKIDAYFILARTIERTFAIKKEMTSPLLYLLGQSHLSH